MKNILIVGLTGGIASGKSVVLKMFKKLGAIVYDADRIAHQALFKNSECYKLVLDQFGKEILNSDGSINRKKLAKIAFINKDKQEQLCRIIHPWVFEYLKQKITLYKNSKTKKVIVVDAVLLIESGLYLGMNKIIVVKATKQQQYKRAHKFRTMSPSQVKERMQFQMANPEKIKYADYVVDNRKTLKYTERQVKKIWQEIMLNNL
ncbi:MAG: dephospho-CoA kinase [Candidatus Omnitrophota bacterium]